jgi:disulfide oxidoreductase YuzD
MKYYDIMNKEETGYCISFNSQREAENWLNEHIKKYPEYVARNGYHIVENERLTLSEMNYKAFVIANNAIYFNDGHDYLSALYDVCKMLNPNIDDTDIGKDYIE